jgi:hypothetical protein
MFKVIFAAITQSQKLKRRRKVISFVMTERDVFVADDALCRELQQAGIKKWPNTLKSGLML